MLSLVFEPPLSIVDLSKNQKQQDFIYSYYIPISLKSQKTTHIYRVISLFLAARILFFTACQPNFISASILDLYAWKRFGNQ